MRTLLSLIFLLAVTSVACGDDDGAPRTDSGPDAVDAGPGTDAGPPMDAGPGADAGPGTDGGPGADSGPGADAAPTGCEGSGGTVSTGLCCMGTSDFPDTCAVGACGCAPMYSHEVMVCQCPSGACFDGTRCRPR